MNVSFTYEWQGLTLQVDAEIQEGEPAKLNGLPEDNYPGSPDEVTDMTVTVGGEDFDTDSVRFDRDVSHTYSVNKRGEICWKFNDQPIIPHSTGRLRAGRIRRTRPTFAVVDGTFQRTGEESYIPVFEQRDLTELLLDAALEEAANQ